MDETVIHFLEGTFHQDMGSPEEAVEEFTREADPQYREEMVNQLKCFLNSRLTDREKNDFIEDHTAIYFPALQMTPMDWLQSVISRLSKE